MTTIFNENLLREALAKLKDIEPAYEFMASPYWPKDKPNGTQTVICKAHPFVQWLGRVFKFDTNEYFEVPKFTWHDPIVVDNQAMSFFPTKRGRTVIASQEQIDEMKRVIKI